MKRLHAALIAAPVLAATLAVVNPLSTSAAPAHSMAVRVLSPTRTPAIVANKVVTFNVRATGITLDAKHMGKSTISGHGHIQVYLDSIPSDAYKKAEYRHLVLAVGVSKFTWQVSKPWAKANKGHHKLIFALAQNNNVLYHGGTATLSITVR